MALCTVLRAVGRRPEGVGPGTAHLPGIARPSGDGRGLGSVGRGSSSSYLRRSACSGWGLSARMRTRGYPAGSRCLRSGFQPEGERRAGEVRMMYPFERFSESAKKALTLAQDEAEKSHHSYIGTEHLLLGLLREEHGLGAKVLISLGVEIDKVRSTIASILGRNERIIIQQIIPTSRVKKVIGMAFEEAQRMNSAEVGTEHLLLGLVGEGEGIAAHVLEDLGATQERVRAEIGRLRGENPPPPAAPRDPRLEEFARLHDQLHQGGGPVVQPAAIWSGYLLPLSQLGHAVGRPVDLAVCSAILLAEEEAVKTAAPEVGPEHLVVGLLRQGEGFAARAMALLKVEIAALRQLTGVVAPSADALRHRGPLHLSQEVLRELQSAVGVSVLEGRELVDTGDVLLAVAGRLVAWLGRSDVDPETVRKAVADSREGAVES